MQPEYQPATEAFTNPSRRGDAPQHSAERAFSQSPFSSLPWREIGETLKQAQIAQTGNPPRNDGAQPRTFTIGPTQLMPSEVCDLQSTFDTQSRIQRSLRWLRENDPQQARGISPDIISAETVQRIAGGIHGVADRLAPGQQSAPVLQIGLGQSIFEHAQRAFPNDPSRQRDEIGVQLALLGRSLNQELERLGSPVRLGPLQTGVDEAGHTFFGLPVRHNGVQTNMLRFPPLMSPQEMQRQRDNRPRLV